MSKHAVRFFDAQFQRQAEAGEYRLNPFENAALPFLSGDVLDLGCGLGNLAIAAARKGCRVTAIDGSPAAVEDLKRRAAEEALAITATCADRRAPKFDRTFDACVAIGLFMFCRRADAAAGLLSLIDCVRPGGILVVNVLIEGTTSSACSIPTTTTSSDRPRCAITSPAGASSTTEPMSFLHQGIR